MEEKKSKQWVSWNENIQHPYLDSHTITSEDQLISLVKQAKNLRVHGSKQSSSDIAAGTSTIVDIRKYNTVVSFDKQKGLITVQAGITLKDLIETIEKDGWCIPCLPDINTVTLSGAIATGTHGTSGHLLAEYMVSCTVITAEGEPLVVEESDPLLQAFKVSLGVLGLFSTITLQLTPQYTLHVKEAPQADNEWLRTLDEKLSSTDFYRILWLPHTGNGYVIEGNKIDPDKNITTVTGPNYLKHRRNVSKFLYQYTNALPWFTSIANKLLYRLFFTAKKESKGSLYGATVTKSRGSTLELAEWTISYDQFKPLFNELKTTINSWSNKAFVHIPMDIRFIEADESWLSYAYKQKTVTVGCVTRNANTADDYAAFKVVEELFLKYGGKPHWGKRFNAKDKELEKLYPKWNDFKTLRKKLDPTNKFLNSYLASLFDEKLN